MNRKHQKLLRFLTAAILTVLSGLPALGAQYLENESLGNLFGDSIYPQDSVLGLMYVPEKNSQSGQEIFKLMRKFWNDINVGKLDKDLLSLDGRLQIREQVAPFLRKTPVLYRESFKAPEKQFEETVPGELATAENNTAGDGIPQNIEDSAGEPAENPGLPPSDYLRLSRVRPSNPVIENDYARMRCRLEINDNTAFIQVKMFFLLEYNVWKVDALAIDWEDIVSGNTEPMNIFGRKQELYPQ
ncbi:hypothetical protein P0082_12355 [Candidatus Haliotispira prima]|uniref:Uncharacterized protein n=1 Tax=Candidatus Haliotispira prima TaxID=3034016 RepID=A0ABY8MJ74_9SPIO|nr:hypothetical protein P0082_12355 [Candidatus Haliotispira prima]